MEEEQQKLYYISLIYSAIELIDHKRTLFVFFPFLWASFIFYYCANNKTLKK